MYPAIVLECDTEWQASRKTEDGWELWLGRHSPHGHGQLVIIAGEETLRRLAEGVLSILRGDTPEPYVDPVDAFRRPSAPREDRLQE